MPAGYETFKSFMKYQNCWMKQSWNLIIIIIIIIIFFFFFFFLKIWAKDKEVKTLFGIFC